MAPSLEHAFTLHVDLSPALDFGHTVTGHQRFIPIIGGYVDGPKLKATILPGGGDWNTLRDDGMGHVLAKYAIQTADGVLVNVINEGFVRKFQKDPSAESGRRDETEWYARTNPRFEVQHGVHDWLNRTVFVGDLHRPQNLSQVTIDVYEVL